MPRPYAARPSPARLLALLAALLLCAVVAVPRPAAAHAALIGTEPAAGAVVATAPARLSLTFSEPVTPLVLTLVRPDGESVPLASFRADGRTVEIDPPPRLSPGTHALGWRVVSQDGHPVAGSLLFSIGAPSPAPSLAEPANLLVLFALWGARVAFYIGLFLGIGGALALAWLAAGGRDGSRFAGATLVLGLAAAPLSLGLQGLDALGAPLSGLALSAVWRAGFATSFGSTALIALASLIAALSALAAPRLARPLTACALAGVGAALAASGHASAAEPQWLTRPMVALHGAAIAFWAGALVPLGLSLRRDAPSAARFLRHFSRSIPPVLIVLAAAGVVLAVIQVETPSALWVTAYGRLLVAKLAVLCLLFGLAAVNRWRLTVPAQQGERRARARLARSIMVETLLVLAIFGIAAGWRFTPPPRALAIAAAQPALAHFHTPEAMAELTVTPGHTGRVSAAIVVFDGDFGPLAASKVTLALSKPGSNAAPLERPATNGGDGIWRVDGLVIPLAGTWDARIDILSPDSRKVSVEGPLDIRP